MESRILRMQIELWTFNNRKILVQFVDLLMISRRDELFEMYESLYKYILRTCVILRK